MYSFSSAGCIPEDTDLDTSSDFLLAQALQHEMNKEHDMMLAREESKFNGSSKGL